MNRGKQANNTCGYKGVQFINRSNKYGAQIKVGTQRVWLGSFETPELAAKAYNDAALKYFGEFAFQNNLPNFSPL